MLALLVLVILSTFGFALLSLSQTEVQEASRQRDSSQALSIADAATERARAELNRRLDADPAKTDFDTELTANGGYIYGAPSDPGAFVDLVSGGSAVGQYRVQIVNNNTGPLPDGGSATDDLDRAVYAVATGRRTVLGHTRQRRIEVFLAPSPLAGFTMGCGEPSQQLLNISGNPTIGGSKGSVHSNCNFSTSGNPTISQNVTAVGTITNSGTPNIGGYQGAGAPPVIIPAIVPADYKKSAYMQAGDYVMRETAAGGGLPASAGIYGVTGFDGSGNPVVGAVPVFDASGGGNWPGGGGGWSYSGTPGAGGKWQYNGGNLPSEVQNKTFYFEKAPGTTAGVDSGNVQISASPGSSAIPWKVTIIAEGHIDVSGNPTMQAADHAKNIQIIAGTDISNSGNATSTWSSGGVIAAHEQIAISGNPEFVGLFLAENAAATDNFVTSTSISGNPTITYNGAPSPPAAWNLPLIRVAWRELP
jgi:type II secretory pathway pseudopilin PulG